jgi:hypothetical protein
MRGSLFTGTAPGEQPFVLHLFSFMFRRIYCVMAVLTKSKLSTSLLATNWKTKNKT